MGTLNTENDELIDEEKELDIEVEVEDEEITEKEEEQEREKEEKKEKRKKKKDKKKKKRKKKDEEEEEEEVKYSIIMWISFILLFFGILLTVLYFLIGIGTFGFLAIIFLIVGLPLFFFEYRKLDSKEKKHVKRATLLLTRDVIIAFIIVGIIMAAIVAYSQVWPPMVVIESNSMQHSNDESYIGTIDTGDLVLVKKAPYKSDVTTYIEGRASGYITYSDYGDVIVFRKYGITDTTPIIHRAMVYVIKNETTPDGYDIPSLENLELNVDWGGWNDNISGPDIPVTSPYNLNKSIWIKDVGYSKTNLTILTTSKPFADAKEVDATTFYLTAGDHNLGYASNTPDPWMVKQEWIIGVARGELPWFGLIKLTLNPESGGCCPRGWGDPYAPKNSWDNLLISIVLIIATPFILDFVIGYLLDVRKKRKAKKKKESGEEEEEPKEKDKKKRKKNKDKKKKPPKEDE